MDSGHVLMSDENQKTMHKFQSILPCGFGGIMMFPFNELPQNRSEQVIHGSLKGGRSVCKPKRHYPKFIVTVNGAEGGFGDVLQRDTNLVVPGTEVAERVEGEVVGAVNWDRLGGVGEWN
nr:hypothetical protein [Tanacetum cinerariifolium]